MSQSGKVVIQNNATGRKSAALPYESGCSLQLEITGTATVSVEWSNDGENWYEHDTIASVTSSTTGAFTVPVSQVAVNVSSYTSGDVILSAQGKGRN